MAATREVRREASLPAFSIGIEEFGLVWSRLQSMFDGARHLSSTACIDLPTERLSFHCLADLKAHVFQRSRARAFSLLMRTDQRSIMLTSPGTFCGSARVVVTADSEMWCAGAREAVVSVVSQNKVWHHWLRPCLLIALLLLTAFGGAALLGSLKRTGEQLDRVLTCGYYGTVSALFVLLLTRQWLLPTATLRLRENESFIRRRLPELTLLLALVSAVMTGIGLLMSRS